MQVTRGTSIVMTAIVFLHLWNCGTQAVEPRTPLEMAQRVDQLLESRLMELGWQPAGPCDDASFLRRLSLDLSGHAPSANEVHQFLQDLSSDKRARLIEKLLNSPISASEAEWKRLGEPASSSILRDAGTEPDNDDQPPAGTGEIAQLTYLGGLVSRLIQDCLALPQQGSR